MAAGPFISRPSGVNVGVNNPGEIVYIKGNAFTDGSIRLNLKPGDTDITLEQRESGVFNPTGLRLSANTLFLDRQLSISSVGLFLQINALGPDRKFLATSIEYDDTGSDVAFTPIIGVLETDVSEQPIFNTEKTSKTFFEFSTIPVSELISVLHLKTGTTAATEPVNMLISTGTSPGGTIIFDFDFPASQFPANSDISIVLDSALGFVAGEDIVFGFISAADFSLLGNPALEPFLEIDRQLINSIDLSTINGNAVSFVNSATGITLSVSGVDVWTDIDDGGVSLIWALATAPENFTITDTNNGEITYDGFIDCGIRVGGSCEVGAMAGMDGVEIGISLNGATPDDRTITTGFVTPTQLDSITIATAKITIEPGDTLKLQFRNISKTSGVTFFQAKQSVF